LYLRELSDVQNLGIAMDHVVGIEKPSLGSDVVAVISDALHWMQTDAYQTTGMWRIGGIEPWLDIQRQAAGSRNFISVADCIYKYLGQDG
jgi:ribonuclease Z